MVVDVDDEVLIEPLDAGAPQLTALHDDGGVELAVDALGDPDRRHAGKGHQGGGAGVLVHDLHVLAERAQRERHRELRADGVAVRPRVRADHEPLALADRLADVAATASALLVAVVWWSGILCGTRVGGVDLLQQLLDTRLVGNRLVEDEGDLRHAPQPQALRRAGGGRTASRGRAPSRCSLRGRVAERRVVDVGDLQVGADTSRG